MNIAVLTLRPRERVLICAVSGLLFSNVVADAQSPQGIVAWAKTTGESLTRFLPSPVPGLIPRMSRDSTNYNQPNADSGYGEGSRGNEVGYIPIFVTQNWRYDEPELVQQAAASRDKSMSDAKQQAKDIQDYQKAHAAEIKEVQKQMADLARAGRYQEMQEAQKKLMALMSPPGSGKNLDAPDPLKRARSLNVLIIANETRLPSTGFIGGNIPGNMMTAAGALKGHPLYRYTKHRDDFGALSEQVVLAVFLGPAQFHESFPANSNLIGKLKCISVRVNVQSRPDTAKADEQLARQLLETIDYDGLAKLIER